MICSTSTHYIPRFSWGPQTNCYWKHGRREVLGRLLQIESSFLRGAVLANSCGLGKTVQTLALISLSPTVNGRKSPFKPTLITVPALIIEIWHAERVARFKSTITFVIFYRSKKKKETSDPLRRDVTVDPSCRLCRFHEQPRSRRSANSQDGSIDHLP